MSHRGSRPLRTGIDSIQDVNDLSSVIESGDAAGGELAGTYPNPTVAATHSGSAHHTQSHDHSAAGDGTTLNPATINLPANSVNAITEIAAGLKSGADVTLVTGTAGTNGHLAQWNADGDLVNQSQPTLSDYTNATHDHSNDANGGTLTVTFAEIEVGSYTGDGGTSQVISLSASFTPVYVLITTRHTGDNTDLGLGDLVFTSTSILDDHASGGAILHDGTGDFVFRANRIIALGAGSFTVDDGGSDLDPNTNTVVYNYVAIG